MKIKKCSKTLLVKYTHNITKVSSQMCQDSQVNRFCISEVDSKNPYIIKTSKIRGMNPEETTASLRYTRSKLNK